MLKSCRALVSACSSLKHQAFVRPISVSAKRGVGADPSKEEVDKLFASEPDNAPGRRGHAFSLNRVDLIGGIAAEPKLRSAKNGREYLTFTMITNRIDRLANGDMVDRGSEAHVVTIFNGVDRAMRSLQRGKRVFVSGRLHYSPVTQTDGTIMSRATITAEIFQVLEARRGDNFEQRGESFESSHKEDVQ